MTHDELLARLDLYEADYFDFPNKELIALRAVIELHEPQESDLVEQLLCRGCQGRAWPCSTIKAIEKELK